MLTQGIVIAVIISATIITILALSLKGDIEKMKIEREIEALKAERQRDIVEAMRMKRQEANKTPEQWIIDTGKVPESLAKKFDIRSEEK